MDGNLRRTVETEGKPDSADAAVDVELHLAKAKVTFNVLLSHGRKYEWAVEGQANLSAVRVAREHQVYRFASRVLGNGVRIVRLMNHENYGSVGFFRQGEIQVGVTGNGIVGTA
jgi:hypothetical protein